MRNADTILPDITPAVRWFARISSIILFILIITVFIGEGKNFSLSGLKMNELIMTFSLMAAIAGLLLGWVWELIGGIITILGLLTFSIVNHFAGGDMPWAIWVMAIPAVLFIIYWWRTS